MLCVEPQRASALKSSEVAVGNKEVGGRASTLRGTSYLGLEDGAPVGAWKDVPFSMENWYHSHCMSFPHNPTPFLHFRVLPMVPWTNLSCVWCFSWTSFVSSRLRCLEFRSFSSEIAPPAQPIEFGVKIAKSRKMMCAELTKQRFVGVRTAATDEECRGLWEQTAQAG